MTMPDERTRSIRWGFELLGDMLLETSIDASIRAIAQRLLETYPNPELVLTLINADAPKLPEEAAEALVAAGELWQRLRRSNQGTEETRHSLLFTERHFPNASTSSMLGRKNFDGLRIWLLPEDDAHQHSESRKAGPAQPASFSEDE